MGSLQSITVMITSLIILYTIPSTTSIGPDQPTMILIDSICIDTVNVYYCEQSIIPKLDTPHAEITTIAKIAAFNALYTAKITTGLIRNEFLPKAGDPQVTAQLRTCLATYNGVDKYLDGAYKAVVRNEYAEMRRYQSYVLGLLDNCKTDFDPMVRKNWWARLMINISILAARKLPA